MASSDSSFWKEAANSDIDSILRNYMWELVDLPPGNKPLGSKWIFQRKMKADGTIDKYKARLVVKGFKHKEGLDYFDTYSPLTRITSIQMLIALVAVYDLEIHQIDMKTAFLNGELEEEIYIEQPKDFVVLGKENKVLDKFKYMEFGIAKTPLDVSFALRKNEDESDLQLEYARVLGCLMYIMNCTRLDIACAIAIPALSPERNFFSIIKAFAAGVILSTGFIHVLPDAFDKLTSPYLKELPWKKFSFGGFVAMVSAMGTLMVDTYATSYYNKRSTKSGLVAQSGDEVGVIHAHSHGHVHSAAPIMGESVSELLRYRVISQAGVDPRCSRGSPEPLGKKLPYIYKSIVDHVKVTEVITRVSQGGAKRVHHFSTFKSRTSRGRDFRGSHGRHGTFLICFRLASVLFDPGSTFSYAFVYFALGFDFVTEPLSMLIHVSTLVDMVDFDAILGMNWLAPSHAILNYYARTVTLASPNVPRIAWKSTLYSGPKRVISYVQACKLVERGCLSYSAHIRYTSVVSPPSLDSVCVVREFIDVFSTNLPSMPSD
ncbi:hypothetical protein BC332_18827 [Capsicum chinense]|nr:hypothetical protein BC332_18827 [Capsicum chinense]